MYLGVGAAAAVGAAGGTAAVLIQWCWQVAESTALERVPGTDLRLLLEQDPLLRSIPSSFTSMTILEERHGYGGVLVTDQHPSDNTM